MSKNILIISTSLRKGSNSEMLAGGLTALRKPTFLELYLQEELMRREKQKVMYRW